uniref:Uncharacterized protein n=1 Tax=Aegilops tauschii subsp. strangulata TaxID=200361 RepID=A0A452YPW3_AEGTS
MVLQVILLSCFGFALVLLGSRLYLLLDRCCFYGAVWILFRVHINCWNQEILLYTPVVVVVQVVPLRCTALFLWKVDYRN